jgi:nucleoside-diphosphate-sugar epimerase
MADVSGARVLVTGAGGFIGANLVRKLLGRGGHVIATVRPEGSLTRLAEIEDRIEVVPLDLNAERELEATVARVRPDLAIGLAAPGGHPYSAEERRAHLEVSVLGTARLTEALAVAGCARFVYVGSSLEYGPKVQPMQEDDLLEPVVPRGAAKAAATITCLAWARAVGLPALVVRPFSVYGPWEAESRFVPTAVRAAMDGRELRLTEPGIVRDYVYVGDVVDGILAGLAVPSDADGRIVNLGSGTQTTTEELVALVERVVGREIETHYGSYPVRPHDATSWRANVDLAKRLLGWNASTSLEEGVRRTHAWLTTRAHALRA